MSIRRPDLGPAGSGELDNPAEPTGLGPGASGTFEGASLGEPLPPQPLSEPREPQPVAGGIEQPLGIGSGGDSGADRPTERRQRQEDPERWQREERRNTPFEYQPDSMVP